MRFFYFILLFLFTACQSQHNTSSSLLQKNDIQEIDIQSPFQNLKIFNDNDSWKGKFLPTNDPNKKEEEFKFYSFDKDNVESLIDVFSQLGEKKSSTPLENNNSVKIIFKTSQGNKEWIISKEDPLRRIVLRTSTDWRSKQILNKDASRLEEITLIRPPQNITLIKNDDNQWIWKEKPNTSINQDWLDSLARKLSHLKVMSVGEYIQKEEAGLVKPSAEVLIKFRGQDKPFHVLLGKQKGQNLYYGEFQGLPEWDGEIFTLNQETAEKLMSSLSQIIHEDKK